MKLKQIAQEVLNEIKLMSGDADHASSLKLFNLITYSWRELAKVHPPDSVDSISGQPLDAKVIALIKKTAIDYQGTLYICKYYNNGSGNDRNVLFKIDEPYATACVGMIDTAPNKGAYSIATMYGINAPQVHWSIIADEYKGMKYGAFLYDTLLYRYGALQSDHILYEGSLNMWIHHMSSTGRMTAAVMESSNYWGTNKRVAVPITVKDLKDRRYLEHINSIAVFYDVPAQLQVLNKFAGGLTPGNGSLGIIYFDGKLEQPNKFETVDVSAGFDTDAENEDATLSMADFLDQYSYDDLIAMADQGEVQFGSESRIFMQDSDGFTADDWQDISKAQKVILVCDDAVVLVEPTGDEIKYQLI